MWTISAFHRCSCGGNEILMVFFSCSFLLILSQKNPKWICFCPPGIMQVLCRCYKLPWKDTLKYLYVLFKVFFFSPSFKQIWSWRFLSILWYYFFSPHFLGIQCLAEHRSLAGEQFLKYSIFGRLIGTEPRATPARQSYFSFAVYAFINTDKRQKALLQHYMQSCYIQSWNWESVLDYTVSPYQDHTTRIQSNPNTTHARWSHPVCVGY